MVMKKTWIVFSLIFLFYGAPLFSQSAGSRIQRLVGGHLSVAGTFSSSALSTFHAGRFTASGDYLAWMDFYQNPAFSTGIKKPYVAYFMAPPISIHPNRFIDIDRRVQSAMNNGVANYRAPGLAIEYPQTDLVFRTNQLWGQGLVSFPAGGMVFTFGYQRPLFLNLNAYLTGIETTISTEVPMGGQTSDVVLNAYLDAAVHLTFSVDKTSIGGSKIIRNRFAFGFSIDRYGGNVKSQGFADAQGDMLFNGQEYIFNNPNDAWYNKLTQSISGGYQGSGWRTTWGGWYFYNKSFLFDAVLSMQSPIRLEGDFNILVNKIPALNLNALSSNNPNEEILDPAGLDLARLTLTQPVQNKTYPEMLLHLPSYLKLGVLYQKSNLYWYNNVSLKFGYTGVEYGPYKIGVSSNFDWQSIFGLNHFYIVTKIDAAKTVLDHTGKWGQGGNRVWIPSFALGYGRLLRHHYPVQLGLSLLPEPIVYFSTGYQF